MIIIIFIIIIFIIIIMISNDQDSAEKHSVIWRNAAGEEVEEEGRSQS